MVTQRKINKDEKRRLILDTALKLFSSDGYNGTSMSKIAKEVGIAKGSVYTYFESKEDLLKAIINDGFDTFLPSMEPLMSKSIDSKVVEFFIRKSVQVIINDPEFWRLFFAFAVHPAIPKEFINEIMAKVEPFFGKLGGYFAERGSSNPEAETMLFVSTLDGMSINYLANSDFYPINDVCNLLVEKYC